MAKITKVDPAELDKANVVLVDVEAEDNFQAIDAMENWATEHGFARTRENFLRIILEKSGSRVFRGTCYRMTQEEKHAIDLNFRAMVQRAQKIGAPSRSAS